MTVWFEVELHRNGILRRKFEVPANATRGLMYVPDFAALCEKLPAQLWPAIQRGSWWGDKHAPSMPLRLDMTDKRGKPLGSLFATQKGAAT